MKITAIRTRPYQFELKRPIGDVNFPEGRKLWAGPAVFIDTDEGLCGVSVGNPGSRPFVHSFESLLVGEDPRGVRGLWKNMIDRVFKGGNRGVVSEAVSCLDIALWDLKAKANQAQSWSGPRNGSPAPGHNERGSYESISETGDRNRFERVLVSERGDSKDQGD